MAIFRCWRIFMAGTRIVDRATIMAPQKYANSTTTIVRYSVRTSRCLFDGKLTADARQFCPVATDALGVWFIPVIVGSAIE